MRFRCPNCGVPVDASALRPGERVICQGCRKRLKTPQGDGVSLEARFDDETLDIIPPASNMGMPTPTSAWVVSSASPPPPPPPPPPPIIVAIPFPAEPHEYVQENIESMRLTRSERVERRSQYNLDRTGNPIGMASFAMAITSFVLAASGGLFARDLPGYTLFIIFLGLPLALAALPCGIVGCLKPGRNKLYSAIGMGASVLLMLVLYPVLMLELKNRWGG